LPSSAGSNGAQSLALTIPSVGAYLSGAPTVAHTWCPSGIVGDYASLSFYPQGDTVLDTNQSPVRTDALAASPDGNHILGAALNGSQVLLSDIGVTIPETVCRIETVEVIVGNPPHKITEQKLLPLEIEHTLNQTTFDLSKVNATAVNQVVAGIRPTVEATSPEPSIAFITYSGNSTGAMLPYYLPTAGNTGALGTPGYVTLMNGSSASTTVTAPIAGVFSPDDTLFFVSTSGDNMIHYIDLKTLTDTQQISPNLPACAPGSDPGCTNTAVPAGEPVPATAIVVKPRSTT